MTDWRVIVRRHGPMAYETAWRILGDVSDTEDAVQEAFLDALRLCRRQAVSNWGGLLRRLASCRALDALRRRRPLLSFETEPAAPHSARPDATAIASEAAMRLRQALTELPKREAEVFTLRYLADLTNSEIAAALDVSTGAVAIALHKARSRLRSLLCPREE